MSWGRRPPVLHGLRTRSPPPTRLLPRGCGGVKTRPESDSDERPAAGASGRNRRTARGSTVYGVSDVASRDRDEVGAAELLAGLCLATDLGRGFPLEHGLHSTLVATRLCERLHVDQKVATDTYYGCLLFYVGCTADAEIAADLFEDGMLSRYFDPVIFGSPAETLGGVVRALAGPGPPPAQVGRVVRRLPRAMAGHRRHMAALCEVGRLLSDRMGVGSDVPALFTTFTERWDGHGEPARLRGEQLPLPLRIMQVARDATYQALRGGPGHAGRVMAQRSGHAFDPAVVAAVTADVDTVLGVPGEGSAWEDVLAAEPGPPLRLATAAIDRALAAMGDFADLVSPFLVGHSSGVADLVAAAGRSCGLSDGLVRDLRRAALIHDVGRVAVPASVWQKPGPLTTDERERVRLHAYHGERALCRSPFLARLLPVATAHHERLDGSGYHRGAVAAALPLTARLLAAADVYRAMTEPRPHRPALSATAAGDALTAEVVAGRLDDASVAAVLTAAGQPARRRERPAGLSERELHVLALLARGLQTKQVARVLGISTKTADHHVQNAYAKIGVSTRAAAAVFAMEHGLLLWGELPIPAGHQRS
jgi:HD-GYP domain-containing protein (c-di-GMP phosphodiesterase class II)